MGYREDMECVSGPTTITSGTATFAVGVEMGGVVAQTLLGEALLTAATNPSADRAPFTPGD